MSESMFTLSHRLFSPIIHVAPLMFAMLNCRFLLYQFLEPRKKWKLFNGFSWSCHIYFSDWYHLGLQHPFYELEALSRRHHPFWATSEIEIERGGNESILASLESDFLFILCQRVLGLVFYTVSKHAGHFRARVHMKIERFERVKTYFFSVGSCVVIYYTLPLSLGVVIFRIRLKAS